MEPTEAASSRVHLPAWLDKVPLLGSRPPKPDSAGDTGVQVADRSEGRRWTLPAAVVGLLMILGFTVIPHVWFGYEYLYKSYDFLVNTFVVETTTSTSLATTTTEVGATGSTDSTVPASTTTTVPPATVKAGDDGQLTILFLGSDAGVGRTGESASPAWPELRQRPVAIGRRALRRQSAGTVCPPSEVGTGPRRSLPGSCRTPTGGSTE